MVSAEWPRQTLLVPLLSRTKRAPGTKQYELGLAGTLWTPPVARWLLVTPVRRGGEGIFRDLASLYRNPQPKTGATPRVVESRDNPDNSWQHLRQAVPPRAHTFISFTGAGLTLLVQVYNPSSL
mmetsp:Transcript_8491/g.31367  ORF Transcript_8491/g.31367 Transcript_8491/m.31367 type:complete len:124 (+) Transcript_8491:2779-3150(+)